MPVKFGQTSIGFWFLHSYLITTVFSSLYVKIIIMWFLFFYLQCPKCNICIEKNGGCNHMQCYHCKHDFCWMCLGDWKTHGSEYYECSRYKENPNIAHESVHAQAREALKKYLHYYERVSTYSFFSGKVENFLKGSLDSIPLPYVLHLQWKFKLWAGKFAWGVKAKHCWAQSTNF